MVSRLYGNGATVIPKEVRKALNIETGDIIVWRIDRKRKLATISIEKDILKDISREIIVKGRWAGKLYSKYIDVKKSKK